MKDIFIFSNPTFDPVNIPHPPSFERNEDFPNCCEFHKNVVSQLQTHKIFIENYHKEEALNQYHLKPCNYPEIEKQILDYLSYTEFFIKKKINEEAWYVEITNYIDYIINAFGSPSPAIGFYLQFLSHYITYTSIEMSDYKRLSLKDYVEVNLKPKKGAEKSDINELLSIYEKWLEIFPFEITLEKKLKEFFSKKIPLFSGKSIYNPYLKCWKGRIVSKRELVQYLIKTTELILERVGTSQLLKKGIIKNIDSHTIVLIEERHRVKQTALLSEISEDESRYLGIIKEWLSNEKEYIEDYKQKILPILNSRSFEYPEEYETTESISKHIPDENQYTFDNWKVGKLKSRVRIFSGKRYVEFQKIRKAKEDTFEHFRKKQLIWNQHNFVDRYISSIEPDYFLETEIEETVKFIELKPDLRKELARKQPIDFAWTVSHIIYNKYLSLKNIPHLHDGATIDDADNDGQLKVNDAFELTCRNDYKNWLMKLKSIEKHLRLDFMKEWYESLSELDRVAVDKRKPELQNKLELENALYFTKAFNNNDDIKSTKNKIPVKYYALYHWVLIEMGLENHFELNENDQYPKKKITDYAENKYGLKDGQGFYRAFRDIDLTNKLSIANSFGRGYKEKIIEISEYDSKVITHLKDYPN